MVRAVLTLLRVDPRLLYGTGEGVWFALPVHFQPRLLAGDSGVSLCFYGAGGRSRTLDLRITNALLYQLSYTGVGCDRG